LIPIFARLKHWNIETPIESVLTARRGWFDENRHDGPGRRAPEAALRLVLAATLILVAGNLANHELHSWFSNIAAFAPSASH